jgi:hypothetical protein
MGLGVVVGCADRTVGPATRQPPSALRADEIVTTGASTTLFWQQAVRDAIVRARVTPQPATRALALTSFAQYVAALHADGEDALARLETRRGAIAAASAAVLAYVFPADAALFESMLAAQRAHSPGDLAASFISGEAIGRAQAGRVITRARGDRFSAVWTGQVPVGEGLWTSATITTPPTAPLLGQMLPFFLTSGDQFRPPPPPAFRSPEFQAALDEVRHISDTRTADQSRIAVAWGLSTGTITTEGWWARRAGELIAAYGIDELDATHDFALVSMAAMDGLIACFDAKYTYWLIRPNQADPHTATTAGIILAIDQPNHPSYPSAHACQSGASAEVLGELFPFDAGALKAQADEAGLSRIYAGIHYRFDVDAGQTLGVTVARAALEFDRERGLLAVLLAGAP